MTVLYPVIHYTDSILKGIYACYYYIRQPGMGEYIPGIEVSWEDLDTTNKALTWKLALETFSWLILKLTFLLV
jgi:hypothetical protein